MTYEQQVAFIKARLKFADELSEQRDNLISQMGRYPLEISTKEGSNPFFRAVVDSTKELDLVISQLRSPLVTREEAHNQSLVWPKPDGL